MMARPRLGQRVELRYCLKKRRSCSRQADLHGRIGIVVAVSTGPGPRNHGVIVAGELVIVPCGHLRRAP